MGTSTVVLLFRFYGLTFVGGLASFILGLIAIYEWKPDPPDSAFVTIGGALGPYPYYIFVLIGALMTLFAVTSAIAMKRRLNGYRS
jgi:hypothetical protein